MTAVARRRFLPLALLLSSSLATAADAPFVARDLIGDGAFTHNAEGPAAGPDGALYAVNLGKDGTIARIALHADGSAKAEVFVTLPEGSTGNGIRFRDGTMYVADFTGHKILQVNLQTRAVSTFASLPGADGPNDLAIAPDGSFYASDPNWKDNSGRLWHISREGVVALMESGMTTPNGLDVSPDGKHLYVNESMSRKVWVYDRVDGALRNKRLLISFPDFGMDGMRCDADGNLYIARYDAGQIAVVSPQGRLLRTVALKGRKASNVAFGGTDGKHVFVTLQDRGAVETFRSDRPGRETGR
ncbi:SMP-30/gluconolactonase/LRE family protein [Xanthomonas arboricola]|uniref:SMP-30/gluconolactonase/LRE family protein n=5 Tax=Xanthomonas arboricola TaxID=56448 RepID=A0AAQ0W6K5_9XANT|nr:SMP-30/gluconolactonase/LRE family protein [Xanthomonas arboricola]GAE51736.1 gluconolactonase [Xanthomonas arboricola pv. pruni str. MAFF 311562]GAE57235.1 gluconolactonase [Xanthomonas arboricola pv. pruni MAFF 301420]GAE61470.1 gluconolactonase [Xanthomonas arboricola pv. pruni MAFF 301427]KPN10353.1 gluconolactonase [Xanthomonas arboricola pv. pruni]MDN0205892.1 SMP-30/gluconolactonase/LRE family protein [Xanthomonas arboricola pv. corylina]